MQDIPKLFTAIAEWSACLIFVLILKNRLQKWKTAGIMAVFLVVVSILQIYIGIWPDAVWIPAMGVAMLLMYLCIWACCDVSMCDAGVCWAMAFLSAEFIASLEWQLYAFIIREKDASVWLEYGFMFLFYLLGYGALYLMQRKMYPADGRNFAISAKELASSLVMTLAVFLMSNISYVFPNTPFSASVNEGVFYVRTLVDFSGVLILMTQQGRFKENQLKVELATTAMLMKKQFEQYQLSKSNIEILNHKYHDLKHQIAVIRTERDDGKREGYLEELETSLKLYEAQNKTGNSVLDTILTGKSMYCVQEDIHFTCMADGTLLGFMDVLDICSIFGNALDNAIESVEKVKEKEKRIIRTVVCSQNRFIIIRFENYYEESFDVEEHDGIGLPVTTKAEKEYHGFGIKSIRSSVEKYGGTMTIQAEDNWFYLRLLIPMH